MKRNVFAGIALIASLIIGYAVYYDDGSSATATPIIARENTTTSTPESPTTPQAAAALEAKSSSAAASSQSAPQLMGLTPEEMQRLASWSESRGHYLDDRFFGDYLTMSTETLTAIANQDDPKAHLALANRITTRQPAYKVSVEELDNAAQHLYQASALGYTSSLEKLSELMQRRAFSGTKMRDDFLIETYKYIYIDIKRGALSSDERLSSLQSAHPLTVEQNKQAIERAEQTYQDLANIRAEKRLPPFENETPADLLQIETKLRDYFAKLPPQH